MAIASLSNFRALIERQNRRMLAISEKIQEIAGVDPRALPDDVLTSTQPARAARPGRGLADRARRAANPRRPRSAYLRRFYRDATVGALLGAPEIGGRFFYNDDLSGFNFRPVRLKLDAVLDEIARHSDDAQAAGDLCRLDHGRHLPAGLSRRERSRHGRAPAAREHLDRQSHAHRRPSRSAGQHRLRRRRATAASRCFRPSSWRISTSARWISRRPARRSAWWISRSPDLQRFPKFAEALRHAQVAELGPGRCDLHSQHVVASHRGARQPQRAGELLVAPVARRTWIRRSTR